MLARLSGTVVAAMFVAGVAAVPLAANGQESKSAPLAKELTQLLEASQSDSIGASDPASGAFVAALYVPGTQLLVVSGKFPTPDIGSYRLSKKEFRELYMDLMGGSIPDSKQFASDISANGLIFKPAGGAPGDVWENGTKVHTFEGAKKAKLRDDEYSKAYVDADTEYARLLSLLIAQAKEKSGGS